MNELTPLPQLVAEIKILSQQTAANIIEIGKRLNAAKEQLKHGEWESWLKDNFEMSQKRATQFMNVAEQFVDLNTYSDLNPSKIIRKVAGASSVEQKICSRWHLPDRN